jgi:hypothetical protein
VGKLSRLERLCLGALGLLFVILCWNTTKILNLWGDEAYSLDLANAAYRSIWLFSDNHTPAHFLLLKAMASLAGASYAQEPLLRMLHVPFFLAGFIFGYRTMKRAFGSSALAALALLLAMLLPMFPYYATNLRMYAWSSWAPCGSSTPRRNSCPRTKPFQATPGACFRPASCCSFPTMWEPSST